MSSRVIDIVSDVVENMGNQFSFEYAALTADPTFQKLYIPRCQWSRFWLKAGSQAEITLANGQSYGVDIVNEDDGYIVVIVSDPALLVAQNFAITTPIRFVNGTVKMVQEDVKEITGTNNLGAHEILIYLVEPFNAPEDVNPRWSILTKPELTFLVASEYKAVKTGATYNAVIRTTEKVWRAFVYAVRKNTSFQRDLVAESKAFARCHLTYSKDDKQIFPYTMAGVERGLTLPIRK